MARKQPSTASDVGRGVLAGLTGTAVMTAFQKLVEMPVTGREDSYAPAQFAERVLPLQPATRAARRRLNYATHYALGTMWGTAYAVACRAGLRGHRAVGAVFGVAYPGDVLLNTALRLYHPSRWSRQEWVIDVLDKLVQAEATGLVFDHILARRQSA